MQAHPLAPRFWAYAVLLGLLLTNLFSAGLLLLPQERDGPAVMAYTEARLARFVDRIRGGALGVVLIGDSRMQFATLGEEALAASLTRAAGRPVAVIRFLRVASTFREIEPYAEAILDSGASAIVLQHSFMARQDTVVSRIGDARRMVADTLFGRGSRQSSPALAAYYEGLSACEDIKPMRLPFTMLGASVTRDRYAARGESARLSARFTDEAHQRGIAMIVAETPARDIAGVETTLAPDPTLFVHPPRPVEVAGLTDPGLYCDEYHLNETGRALYSDWLGQRIVEALAREGSRE
ncbi:hypothetical protein [Thermohalobaculum sediminis]|uniref:hypothetical protein n=1 Tax=Thermohalobaculum sediminis TaxID=2939436 RepID=UPI0020BEEFC9|nr:hypothetical protein [Limibaculum sediminis]